MKKIDINSFLDIQYVSNPTFSPDGRYAAFVVQRPCLEDNRYLGDLWLLDVERGEVRPLTTAGTQRAICGQRRAPCSSPPCGTPG